MGTMPDATAAAAPPLDPPGLRLKSQGFCVEPRHVGSQTNSPANSGVLVRPKSDSPALRQRAASGASSAAGGSPSSQRHEEVRCSPATSILISLARNGTPARGAAKSIAAAAFRAL